jgi:outer membrane protein assembly factor BamB
MRIQAPFLLAAFILAALAGLATPGLRADGVTYFRSNGGIADPGAGSLPDHLDAPRALLWRAESDPGHSSPIRCGGRIVLTTYRAAEQELATVAFDEKTGQLAWKQPITPGKIEEFHRVTGSPAAATPACDGEHLYVFFGSYGLICYDLDGHKVWEHKMGPFQDEYGASSSPVVVDDKVILNEDHDTGGFLVAFDRASGKTLWRVSRPEAVRSYSTPAVWTRNGRKELLVAGALELAAYLPSSGEKLWWTRGLARIVIPVPAVAGDTVYMASWTPGGDAGKRLALDPWATALSKWDRNHDGKLTKTEITDPEVLDRFNRMDLDQSGDLDQKEWERHASVFQKAQNAILAIKPTSTDGDLTDSAVLWTFRKGVPYVSSPLVHNGIVWMVKEGGIVTKLDAASGKVLQEERIPGMGGYFASPVEGDSKVFFANELGTVSILADQPDWRVISSHPFHEKIYATPLIAPDRIYVRTEKALYCFSGGKDVN